MKRIKFSQHNKTNYITCQNNNLKSVHADYIYHKNEIGKSCEMSLPILKNDITGSEPTVKILDT